MLTPSRCSIRSRPSRRTAGLTDDQLNWHFTEGSWSILDCLQHLNVSVTQTLPAFDRSIAEGREKGQTSNGPFRYGWFARMIARSMEPPPKWRMRAPKLIRVAPASTRRSAEVLPEFARVRDQLGERVRLADGRRHLWQARNVRNRLA